MPEKQSFKEIHGKTRLGLFLKEKAPDLLEKVLNVAGGVMTGDWVGAVQSVLKDNSQLSQEEKNYALELVKLDYENTQDARDMQKVALRQDDLFSKRFVYYMASFWSVVGGLYIFLVTFTTVTNPEHANTIIGFLLGTIVATIINFFFGSSKGSKDKTDLINKLKI